MERREGERDGRKVGSRSRKYAKSLMVGIEIWCSW
jgi:hypothetical protein